MSTHHPHRPTDHNDGHPDRRIERHTEGPIARRDGYTLIELLLVVVILGILTTAAVFAVTGMSAEAAETGCLTDRRQLLVSAESYFAQRHTDLIPATGADHDRFERTLVDEGFMRAPSTFHDLDASGAAIIQVNAAC